MNSRELTDELLQYVLRYFDGIKETDILEAKALNDYDLMITLKNGDKFIFDTFNNSSRKISIPLDYKECLPDKLKIKFQFANCLISMMYRKGMSQEELANKIGTTQPMISRYMNGLSIPSIVVAKQIAMALNCHLDDFFYF
jgi:DNA-binding XRE family transcriptional regulator